MLNYFDLYVKVSHGNIFFFIKSVSLELPEIIAGIFKNFCKNEIKLILVSSLKNFREI